MADPVKTFEILILRPLQLGTTAGAIFLLIRGMWLWLGVCLLAVFYLGIIGSKLHPFQSAADLAEGPLDGPAASTESALLRMDEKTWIVGRACTRVGILVGVSAGIVLIVSLEYPWYAALAVGLVTVLIVGASLKVAFKTL